MYYTIKKYNANPFLFIKINKHMNTNLITNLLALGIMIIGSFSPIYQDTLFFIGIFALSGGLTNWLAIHMLFEKVPLFYGSGIIPNKFEEFKTGIKKLILEEFFNEVNLNEFLKKNSDFNFEKIISNIGDDKIFNKLVEAIEESSLGSMLKMVGGKNVLNPLKEPMINKIKDLFNEFSISSERDNEKIISKTKTSIENIVDSRLKELSPENVKIIIQNMIKQHLSWLVVWGAVIGGLIGLFFSLIEL